MGSRAPAVALSGKHYGKKNVVRRNGGLASLPTFSLFTVNNMNGAPKGQTPSDGSHGAAGRRGQCKVPTKKRENDYIPSLTFLGSHFDLTWWRLTAFLGSHFNVTW